MEYDKYIIFKCKQKIHTGSYDISATDWWEFQSGTANKISEFVIQFL